MSGLRPNRHVDLSIGLTETAADAVVVATAVSDADKVAIIRATSFSNLFQRGSPRIV
jgi:hypothetical protein